jgi:hypothetical protein
MLARQFDRVEERQNEKVSIVRIGPTSWRGLDFGSGQGPQEEQAEPNRFRHSDDRFKDGQNCGQYARQQ